MPYPKIDTCSPGPYWGKKEHIASVHVPLMTETGVFHSPGIPTSVDNPVSCAQANGNGSMSSALSG